MENSALQTIESLLRIRPEESKRTWWSFVYLFFGVGSFITSRIARDSLFLEIPNYKSHLPLTYIVISIAVSASMFLYAKVERKLRRDQTNFLTLTILIVVTLFFRAWLVEPTELTYWCYYIWVELFGAFLIVQFWAFTNEIFHSRQAKRLFAIISGGGVLSNIAFGFSIRGLSSTIGTENLLYLIATCLLVCLFALRALRVQALAELDTAHKKAAPRHQTRQTGPNPLTSRHVKLLATTVLLTFIVSTLVDFQFKSFVGDAISEKDERTAFFGTFFGVCGILGGMIQFGLTSRVVERFGILFALTLLPTLMLSGSMALLTATFTGLSTLLAISVSKGAETILRYTVTDSTMQLMYLPLPTLVRGRAKALIDGVLKSSAIGLTGLMLSLLFNSWSDYLPNSLHFSITIEDLAWLTAAALIGWLISLIGLRTEYLKSLVKTLQQRRLRFGEHELVISDDRTVNTLLATLKSNNLGDVLHALELLPTIAPRIRGQIVPQVEALLQHKSEDVVTQALKYLRNFSNPAIETVEVLLDAESALVRAEAALTYASVGRELSTSRLTPLLEDWDKRVQGAVMAALIKYAGLDGVLACASHLKSMLASPNQDTRTQAAWVLGEVAVSNFYQPLIPLLKDSSTQVVLQAIEAAGKLKNLKVIPELLPLLDVPRLEPHVIRALSQYGDALENEAEKLLNNLNYPPHRRAALAKALAKSGSKHSVEILTEHLHDEDTAIRTSVISAVWQLSLRQGALPIDITTIGQAIRECAKHAARLRLQRSAITSLPHSDLLVDALSHQIEQTVDQFLMLLGFKYPSSTIELVRRNLKSRQIAIRSNAIEVLDNLLDKDDKRHVLPLIEHSNDHHITDFAETTFGLVTPKGTVVIEEYLSSQDPWLRTTALYASRNDQSILTKARIETFSSDPSELVRETTLDILSREGHIRGRKELVGRFLEDSSPTLREFAEVIQTKLDTPITI